MIRIWESRGLVLATLVVVAAGCDRKPLTEASISPDKVDSAMARPVVEVETDAGPVPVDPEMTKQSAAWRASRRVASAVHFGLGATSASGRAAVMVERALSDWDSLVARSTAYREHMPAANEGPSRSQLEEVLRGAPEGRVKTEAGLATLVVEGAELLTTRLDVGLPCRPKLGRQVQLTDQERPVRERSRPVWRGLKADDGSQLGLRLDLETLTLWWFDPAQQCVVGKNVTAELLGLPPDPKAVLETAMTQIRKVLDEQKAEPVVSWSGRNGEEVEWGKWPPLTKRSLDVVPQLPGDERAILGPARFALRRADGSLLWKWAPKMVLGEVCVDNTARIFELGGKVHVDARLTSSSECDYSPGGHTIVARAAGRWEPAQGRFETLVRWSDYDYGASDCGGDGHGSIETGTPLGVVGYEYTSRSTDCLDEKPILCAGIRNDCPDGCIHWSESVVARTTRLWIDRKGRRIDLGVVKLTRSVGEIVRCGGEP